MDIFTDLTPKQACFCNEYFKDFNATKAALRAGYSPKTALNGKLMTLPKIKYHLQQRGAEVAEQAMVSHQMVLAELRKIAFASVGDLFGSDGSLKPIQDVGDDTKAALWNYTVTQGKDGSTTIKIRMSNKLAALEKIAKHIKFYDAPAPKQAVAYVGLDPKRLEADDCYDDDTMVQQQTRSNEVDPTIPTEEEIRNWIKDAREQAIHETEQRLRAEYEGGGRKSEIGGRKAGAGGISVNENTDKYHPSGSGGQSLVRTEEPQKSTIRIRSTYNWH